MTLWLDPIPEEALQRAAREAFAVGDADGFLGAASNDVGLNLVVRNMQQLKERGMYERALLRAFTMIRTNHKHVPLYWQRWLFEQADRARLLAAGDPLPEGERFTLYRGVAGRTSARRIKGFSWTSLRERAQWFANRSADWGFYDPAVYMVTIERSEVWAYSNERKESEFIVLLSEAAKPERVTA